MPTWLSVALSIAGAIASWRWIIRPCRRGLARLTRTLDALASVRTMALELHALAGSFVTYALRNQQRIDDLEATLRQRDEQLADLSQLVIDGLADLSRLRKQVTHNTRRLDESHR